VGFELSHVLIEDQRLHAGCVGHPHISILNFELLMPLLLLVQRNRIGGDVLSSPFFNLLGQVVAFLILPDFLDRLLHLSALWVELRLHLNVHTPLLVNQP